jgi:Protein of unknown function (DUF2459)
MPRTRSPCRLLPLLFAVAYCAVGCSHAVYPPRRPQNPVKVYLANYGWHSGLLLPLPDADGRFAEDGQYVEFTYGDFDYMVNNRDSVIDGMGAILLSPQAGLGRRVIPIRGGKIPRGVKLPPRHMDSFYASAAEVVRLTERLESRFQRNAHTAVLNPKEDAYYVKDGEHYWLANNCNHTARRWLTALGCHVRGSVITLGFALAGDRQPRPQNESRPVKSSRAYDQANLNASIVATPAPPSKMR